MAINNTMANFYFARTPNRSQVSWRHASTTAGGVRYGAEHITQPSENSYELNMDGGGHFISSKDALKSKVSYHMTETDDIPSEWAVMLGVALGVTVGILGLIGNIMTIEAYRRNRKLRTSFNFLITNLCTVDLLFSLVIIPTHLPMMIMRSSSYGVTFCSLVGYFYYCSVSSSVINLVCIALNRYVGIVHSRRYRIMFASGMKKFWLLGIWLSTPLLYFPLLIAGTIRWEYYSLRCEITISSTESTLFLCYQIALSITLQAVPTVVLAVLYRQILQKVKRCRKTVEHFPLTNSPSIATSCMLAGGLVGLNAARKPPSNASSCIDEGGSSENQTIQIKNMRRKRMRSVPSKKFSKESNDPHDLTEGKKAIIVAYLQVPPASISPRRNPHLLYKRSPPQTRTMVVPEGDYTQGQVCLSATASSPNISDADDQTARATSMTFRCSLTRCGKQRSFSTGDENIEPEMGMVGDMEQDLPSLQMMNKEMKNISTHDNSRKCFKSNSVQHSEQRYPLDADHDLESIREKEVLVLTKSISLPEPRNRKINISSFGDDRDNHIFSQDHNKIEERRNVDSISSFATSQRMRSLTRQKPVDEDMNNTNEGQTDQRSEKINMTQSCIRLDNPNEQQLFSEIKDNLTIVKTSGLHDTSVSPSFRKMDIGCTDEKYSNEITPIKKELEQKRHFLKYTSTSSDKGYASQINDCSFQRAESKENAKIPGGKNENSPTREKVVLNDPVESKSFVRRGGQLSHGSVRWLKQFRRGKSLSQSKRRSMYRVRGKTGSKRDAVIRIVIDDPSTEGNWEGSSPIAKRSPQLLRKSGILHSEDSESSHYPIRETTNYPLTCNSPEEGRKNAKKNRRSSQDSNEPRCLRALWEKLLSELNPRKSVKHDGRATSLQNNGDENYIASDDSVWCEEDEGISDGTDKSEQDDISLKSTGTSRLLTSPKTSGESAVKKIQPKEHKSRILTVPQLTVEHDSPFTEAKQDTFSETNRPSNTDEDCKEKRKRFASGCEFRFAPSWDFSEREETVNDSHDTDFVNSKECGTLLEKRSEINASQYLRVGNASTKSLNIETGSVRGDDIPLGRRWSGQSDAISIYSGRFLMCSDQQVHHRGSIHSNSACSGVSAALSYRNSKRSESSQGSAKKQKNRSRRKSVYARWVPKKSSVTSSFGSHSSSRRRRREAEKRLAYSGFAICIAFAVCVLPMSTVNVLRSTTDFYIYPEIDFGVTVLSWLHAIINPILYGLLNPQYRAEYRKMFRKMRSCLICKRDDSMEFAGRTSRKFSLQRSVKRKHGNSESPNHQQNTVC